jgi:hypothetical protein
LSQTVSQSSSTPLHVSPPATHDPQVQLAEQTRVPVEPQDVAHVPVDPRQHSWPLSQTASQSSSAPLHVSGGARHGFQVQEAEQVRVPVVPQTVEHVAVVSRQHE